MTTDDTISKSSGCPFSKAFPRYQINLSRLKDPSKVSWLSSPFQGISNSVQRSKLESMLSRQGEEVYWDAEVEGVSAISILWHRSSLMVSNARAGSSEIIALPGASLQLVQNWVEIVQWISDGDDSLLRATLLTSEPSGVSIPAVRLELFGTLGDDVEDELGPIANTDSSDVLNARTRAWVKRILVEQGICPFTKSVTKSGHGLSDVGVPVGKIAYHASFAEDAFQLLADTWKAIDEMIKAGPSGKTGVSSILLAAPAFDDDFDFWAGPIFAILEASVVAAQAQEQIGVVCFHPQYATPDGKSWPGFGHMHSLPRLQKWYQEHSESKDLSDDDIAAGGAWQRRTPHATINVLRADQLEAAEAKRMSGSMYTENIEKLMCSIGSSKLAHDLDQERQLL